jgi:hypothetical protein
MDLYKWYASNSVRMDDLVFTAPLFSEIKESFVEAAQSTFGNKESSGIESYLLIYLRLALRKTHYEIFFSVDGTMCRINGLKEGDRDEDIKAINIETGLEEKKEYTFSLINFIMQEVIQNDIFKVRSKMQQGQSVAIIQVDFDDRQISTETIRLKLRALFDKYFVSNLGEMPTSLSDITLKNKR